MKLTPSSAAIAAILLLGSTGNAAATAAASLCAPLQDPTAYSEFLSRVRQSDLMDGEALIIEFDYLHAHGGLQETSHPYGTVLSRECVVSGRSSGPSLRYYSNGRLQRVDVYRDGKLSGITVGFAEATGELELIGRYRDGARDFGWCWHDTTGKLYRSIFYQSGERGEWSGYLAFAPEKLAEEPHVDWRATNSSTLTDKGRSRLALQDRINADRLRQGLAARGLLTAGPGIDSPTLMEILNPLEYRLGDATPATTNAPRLIRPTDLQEWRQAQREKGFDDAAIARGALEALRENGHVRKVTRDGDKLWAEGGMLEGKLEGACAVYAEGVTLFQCYEGGYRHGPSIARYERTPSQPGSSHGLLWTGTYLNHKREGRWTFYDREGAIDANRSGEYRNGVKQE